MAITMSYDGNLPCYPVTAVKNEAWDIRQSGSEGDFNTKEESL